MKKIILPVFVLAMISCSSDDNPTPEPTDPLKTEKEMIIAKWPVEKYVRKEVRKDKLTGAISQILQPDGTYKDTLITEADAVAGAYWDFRTDEKIYRFNGNDGRDTVSYRLDKETTGLQLWVGSPEHMEAVKELTAHSLILSQTQGTITGGTIIETEYITYLKK